MSETSALDTLVARQERWSQRATDARNLHVKLFTAGNAGGVIATLGLIGTSIRSGQGSYPEAYFWTFIIFLVGFVCAIIGAYADFRYSDDMTALYRIPNEQENFSNSDLHPDAAQSPKYHAWLRRRNLVYLLGVFCFLIGTIVGIIALYRVAA